MITETQFAQIEWCLFQARRLSLSRGLGVQVRLTCLTCNTVVIFKRYLPIADHICLHADHVTDLHFRPIRRYMQLGWLHWLDVSPDGIHLYRKEDFSLSPVAACPGVLA